MGCAVRKRRTDVVRLEGESLQRHVMATSVEPFHLQVCFLFFFFLATNKSTMKKCVSSGLFILSSAASSSITSSHRKLCFEVEESSCVSLLVLSSNLQPYPWFILFTVSYFNPIISGSYNAPQSKKTRSHDT